MKDIPNKLVKEIGNMYPILEGEIKKFVGRVIEDLNAERLHNLPIRLDIYACLLRKEIKYQADLHPEEKYVEMENTKELKLVADFSFPAAIGPCRPGNDIANSLYER